MDSVQPDFYQDSNKRRRGRQGRPPHSYHRQVAYHKLEIPYVSSGSKMNGEIKNIPGQERKHVQTIGRTSVAGIRTSGSRLALHKKSYVLRETS